MRPVLTRRQMEVLALIRADPEVSYPALAQRLGCSYRTVRAHVEAIAVRLPWPELPPRRAVQRYVRSGSD